MPNWKAWIPSGLPLAAGIGSVLEGVPWQIALPWTLLFAWLGTGAAGLAALWRSFDKGNWVRREEHDRLKADHEWERAERLRLQELVNRLSQTNAVAVGRLKAREPKGPEQ